MFSVHPRNSCVIIKAFGYRRGCGKDTLAKMIQRELRLKNKNLRVLVAGFADQLKMFSQMTYGWLGIKSPQYYEDHPTEKDHPILGLPNGWRTPRDVHIAVGNHMRELDEKVWLNALIKTQSCDVLLIKDLRFEIEIEAVLNHHGEIYRIDRPGTEGNDGQADTVLMNLADSCWSTIIKNDKDLHALHTIAIGIAGTII